MNPFRRILVPIDLDLVSRPILDLVLMVARAFGASVTLVHVFETEGYHGPSRLDPERADDPGVRSELERWRTARAMMGHLRALAAHGIPTGGRMVFGVAEDAIVALAREEGSDLLIVGSHGREGLGRLLGHSVTSALIRSAPCPVLVVPHVPDAVPPA